MFTGIITHVGTVFSKTETGLVLKADKDLLKRLEKGTSVAVDGICLTVVAPRRKNSFEVEVMPETAKKTNLHYLRPGDLVNLELPATANSLLSGHIVQGHIDGTAKLRSILREGNSRILKFFIPSFLSRYIVEKGSVAVNGISLTVMEAKKNYFTVGIIPHTWANTMLHTIKAGDVVNVEVDILAKYVEKLLKKK